MAEEKTLKHLAIICDGNRRWARENGKLEMQGHEEGAKRVSELAEEGQKLGIPVMSFWVMGIDNFKRSETEVSWLMRLGRIHLKRTRQKIIDQNIRFRLCGLRGAPAPKDVIEMYEKMEEETKNNTGMILNLCFNYGGRAEILNAVKEIVTSGIKPEDITEATIEQHLWTAGLPDPDLIIRTSGEQRLSGFMPWQMNYSEFYFPKFSFPEFTKDKLKDAFDVFEKRNRRFGKI